MRSNVVDGVTGRKNQKIVFGTHILGRLGPFGSRLETWRRQLRQALQKAGKRGTCECSRGLEEGITTQPSIKYQPILEADTKPRYGETGRRSTER